jgi:hypothetical protein
MRRWRWETERLAVVVCGAWLICVVASAAAFARVSGVAWMQAERAAAGSLTAGNGALVILVLGQYSCTGRNPGKPPDTRTGIFASGTGSRDIARDRYLCICV